MSLVSLLSEEITIVRESTFPSVAPSADAPSIGKMSGADSVPSTETERTEDESIATEAIGIEMPYIEETGEEASRKETISGNRLKAKWKDARKSLKVMHLFPKRVRNKRRTKKLAENHSESVKVSDPKVSKQDVVGTAGVTLPPSDKTALASNKETEPTRNDSSFWYRVHSTSLDSSAEPSNAIDKTKDSTELTATLAVLQSREHALRLCSNKSMPSLGEDDLYNTNWMDFQVDRTKDSAELIATLAILQSREHSLLSCSDESTPSLGEDDLYRKNWMDFRVTSNVIESPQPPTVQVGTNPATSAFTKVKSTKAVLVEQERKGRESDKLDIDAPIHDQDDKAIQEEQDDDVDDYSNIFFDDFDMIDRFEQEIESGCAGIDLPRTAEKLFVRWSNKFDSMNACDGCVVEDSEDDQEGIDESFNSSEKKTFSADDVTQVDQEVGSNDGFTEGTSENLTGSSSGPDPSNDSELNSCSIDDDESIAAIFFNEEATCDTFSFDSKSLATEYDDFKKAMQLLKNCAAKKGISEARLLEKIRYEQQRRDSLVQLA